MMVVAGQEMQEQSLGFGERPPILNHEHLLRSFCTRTLLGLSHQNAVPASYLLTICIQGNDLIYSES